MVRFEKNLQNYLFPMYRTYKICLIVCIPAHVDFMVTPKSHALARMPW